MKPSTIHVPKEATVWEGIKITGKEYVLAKVDHEILLSTDNDLKDDQTQRWPRLLKPMFAETLNGLW